MASATRGLVWIRRDLRLEDHHRVALERRLRHGLGRRRLDDLRLAGLWRKPAPCTSTIFSVIPTELAPGGTYA